MFGVKYISIQYSGISVYTKANYVKQPNITDGTVTNGSYFLANWSHPHRNTIINCIDNIDCSVHCIGKVHNDTYPISFPCFNSTINCPKNASCSVSCIIGDSNDACMFLKINWIPGNNNKLQCDYWTCFPMISYPPPIDDNTPYQIDCNTENECWYAQMKCPKNAECTINCIEDSVCGHTDIFCPESASCNVNCTGRGSCLYMVVHWASNPSYAHLNCPEHSSCDLQLQLPSIYNAPSNDTPHIYNCSSISQEWRPSGTQCQSSTLNCPKDADCIVNCEGSACIGVTINCPINGNCKIICEYGSHCNSAVINGPIDHDFEVHCLYHDCDDMQIHAENSKSFTFIVGNISIQPALGLSIWFPSRDEITHEKKAKVISLGNGIYGLTGYYGLYPINFYAVHGWLDVEVIYVSITDKHGAIMHCNINYTDSCHVADDSWTCTASNTICDNPFNETMPPTLSPTYNPTAAPTLTPSISPTLEPTPYTSAPTLIPTLEPTYRSNPSPSATTQVHDLMAGDGKKSPEITIIIVSVSMVILLIIGLIIVWKLKSKSDAKPYKNESVDDDKKDMNKEQGTEMQHLNCETK